MTLIITTSVISIFVLLLLLMTRVPNEQPNTQSGEVCSYSTFLIFAFFFILAFAAAFRDGFQDTGLYKNLYRAIGTDYDNASDENFPIQDYGFNLLMVFLNRINPEAQTLIVFCAVVITGIYVYTITKYSSDLPYSLLLFLFLGYIATLNGIRQILAATVIVLAWPWLRDKKYVRFILAALLASTLHASAMVLVPLCFVICGKRCNFLLVLFAAVVSFCFVFPSAAMSVMGDILEDSTYEEYIENESKMGIMRVAVEAVPVILCLMYHNIANKSGTIEYNEKIQRMTDILVNMQLISFGFTVLGLQMVYFARIALYFSLVTPILLPRLINGVFGERTYSSIKSISIALYMFYFGYQIYTYKMIDNWGGFELIF